MAKRKKICLFILIFLIICMFTMARATDAAYEFITKWGSIGSGDGQFVAGPLGLAVDSLGYVYAGGGANGSFRNLIPMACLYLNGVIFWVHYQ